ncbi:drebrin-like protein A [Antennarius striatus]|uniref:drebrin-like protein A n=1 Tax=Antennarius striatus TaxID=241820 RepID=UPI0035B0F596
MSVRSVNLDTYSLSLLTAKEDILNPRSSTNWAIFTYDGITNNLRLSDSGAGGVAELAGKFHISKPQYGLCRVGRLETGAPQIAMISWVGQNVEEYRRTECAGHIPAIKNFFKEAHVFIGAEKVEDVTEERIKAEISKVLAQAPSQWVRRNSRSAEKEELVGTNYRKTNAAMEMRLINRESFWARAEREEEERKDEDRRRTVEERRRLERERVLKERMDEEERDRKMNEKLQMIEEQRRKQAEKEEEMRRKEKSRWDQQQREHEEDMRARLRRSESIEKAAEAAALVSQRSMNPREFFRQLSSSSISKSPTSPGSARTGKPFRRYQRSLTDTAFIFSKAEESTASSPRSPPLVSPFSRAPPSPLFRAASTSPDFGSQSHAAPVSPPASPLGRPDPPVSALPSIPQANQQAIVEPKSPLPTEPSAPPVSPSFLASLSPKLVKNNPSQSNPEAMPASPPNTPTEPEQSAFSFESGSPQAPVAPLPEVPQPNADSTATLSHIGYKVQAVLVEEDEDEEEEVGAREGDVTKAEPQPGVVITETVQVEAEEKEQEEEEVKKEERKEEEEEVEEGEKQEGEPTSVESPVEEVQEEKGKEEDEEEEEKNVQSEAEMAESAVTVCEDIKQEAAVPSANGIPNGENAREHNGIERSLSPSDTELSSPEPVACSDRHGKTEEEEEEEEEEEAVEILKNGQEVLAEQQMCVRALYDYQAEDESEISFEPGDIIRDVETVDKAWWRGWSKDGRQGLFPANYVETI